jgi:hypothetical protein
VNPAGISAVAGDASTRMLNAVVAKFPKKLLPPKVR